MSEQERVMGWTVPDHVPPELVVDIDIFNIPLKGADAATSWRCFQKGDNHLAFSPYNGGHWIATRGEDIPKLYRDFNHLSNDTIAVPNAGTRLLPIQANPPFHRVYRHNINPMFSNEAVDAREDAIRDLTIALVEGLKPRGECEFVADFALQLPLRIFLNMMGIDLTDLPYLREQVETFTQHPDVNRKIAAAAALEAYLEKEIDDRIANPRDDAVTRMVQARFEDRPYTRDETLQTCMMLMLGGLDTVANVLGFTAHHLARHPEQRDYIRANPDKMPVIVQELLRRFPAANIAREVVEDWDYRGVLMKKGDTILLPVSLFNMDPDRLENPDEVDLTRETPHITFGSGRHTCAGALLARKEIGIFLEEWLTRIPDFHVDPDRPPVFTVGAANSAQRVWLKWDVPA